ncbi:response regulator transcription factor [Ideonella sp. 4Y16]|uniref:Response regulator transcription factor n=1 Tax=Ideonella alba TaxID=2824118 RepID=A0A940YJ10_9BURK|nr:response regulator transcription factor [Ideonella alba]MBQ0933297.1 response regulator transcription factor [Ideonella alba]MBQ0943597.1 response regulator transcription factor [Ideonella alba]
MPTTPTLLLAEDDAILADALSAQLQRAGFQVEHAPNGAVAEYLLLRQPWDVAVLDLGLPMVDGLTVLRRVREARKPVPVLVLTALDSLADRVAGLNAGADDYLTKPFDFPELEARLHALLRRSRPATGDIGLGRLVFDRPARRATVDGQALELSPREWLLLELLLSRREQVVTKDEIVQAWAADGADPGAAGSIEVFIHRLRRKLEDSGLSIRTVRGLGYLLEPDTTRA